MVSSVFRTSTRWIDQSGILQDACLAYSSEEEQNLSARPQVSSASGAFTYLLFMIAEGTSAFKGLAVLHFAGIYFIFVPHALRFYTEKGDESRCEGFRW